MAVGEVPGGFIPSNGTVLPNFLDMENLGSLTAVLRI